MDKSKMALQAFYTEEEKELLRKAGCQIIETSSKIYVFENLGQTKKGWADEYRIVEFKDEIQALIQKVKDAK